jgi:DHA1 family multidrug resistance protein B-like MFS transporter
MSFSKLHRTIKIRLLDSFLSSLLGNMLFPFLMIYFAEKLGGTLAGLLSLVGIFAGLLSNFYGGYFADTYGRKRVALCGECLRLFAYLLMLSSNSPWLDSPWLTYAGFLLLCVCWGVIGPAYDAMLVDVSTPDNRKLIYSLSYWGNNLSFVIGGIGGGFFFMEHRFSLYIAVTLAQVLSLLLLIFFISESYTPKPRSKQTSVLADIFRGYRIVFADKTFMLFSLAALLMLSVESINKNYTAVRLSREFGEQSLFGFTMSGVSMFGTLSAWNALLVVTLTVIVTKWIQRFSERRIVTFGIFCYSIGFAIVASSNSPVLLFAMVALATIGELIWVPIKQAKMADLAPAEHRSAYMSMNGLIYRGAVTIASLSVTLGDYLPSIAMSALILLIGATSLLLFLHVMRRNESVVFETIKGIG